MCFTNTCKGESSLQSTLWKFWLATRTLTLATTSTLQTNPFWVPFCTSENLTTSPGRRDLSASLTWKTYQSLLISIMNNKQLKVISYTRMPHIKSHMFPFWTRGKQKGRNFLKHKKKENYHWHIQKRATAHIKVNKINTWKSKVLGFWSLQCSENEVQCNCYLKAQPFSRWEVWKRIPFQLMVVHACSNKRLWGLNSVKTLPLYQTIMGEQFLPSPSPSPPPLSLSNTIRRWLWTDFVTCSQK